MDIYEYTTLRPDCPDCGRTVTCTADDPTQPWLGTCAVGHTHTYQLVDEEDE
jgi:hypothetical protein